MRMGCGRYLVARVQRVKLCQEDFCPAECYAASMIRSCWLLCLPCAALAPAPAAVYCSYKGVMYAKTTIPQEFHDSRWVARVKVTAARDHWSDIEESWTLYRITVLNAYKGRPPAELRFFSFRNSGGFYLD